MTTVIPNTSGDMVENTGMDGNQVLKKNFDFDCDKSQNHLTASMTSEAIKILGHDPTTELTRKN